MINRPLSVRKMTGVTSRRTSPIELLERLAGSIEGRLGYKTGSLNSLEKMR